MVVYDLSPEAVGRMVAVDLATVQEPPPSQIGPFDFHGCICGVASFSGQPPWELHTSGDELLQILAGDCELTVLVDGTEDRRSLHQGDLVLVPQGCWHRNHARKAVTMLFMPPREGGRHSWDDPRGARLGRSDQIGSDRGGRHPAA